MPNTEAKLHLCLAQMPGQFCLSYGVSVRPGHELLGEFAGSLQPAGGYRTGSISLQDLRLQYYYRAVESWLSQIAGCFNYSRATELDLCNHIKETAFD